MSIEAVFIDNLGPKMESALKDEVPNAEVSIANYSTPDYSSPLHCRPLVTHRGILIIYRIGYSRTFEIFVDIEDGYVRIQNVHGEPKKFPLADPDTTIDSMISVVKRDLQEYHKQVVLAAHRITEMHYTGYPRLR